MKVKLLKKIRKDYKVVRYTTMDHDKYPRGHEIYRLLYKGKTVPKAWVESTEDWRVLILVAAYCKGGSDLWDLGNFFGDSLSEFVRYKRVFHKLDKALPKKEITEEQNILKGKQVFP